MNVRVIMVNEQKEAKKIHTEKYSDRKQIGVCLGVETNISNIFRDPMGSELCSKSL